MEQWRSIWRNHVAPFLPQRGLEAIERALRQDDAKLIQGQTCSPPALQCTMDWPVEAACLLGYCGWQGEGLKTVREVEDFFARMCFDMDRRLEERAGISGFLNWFDETPRHEMRAALLPEVKRELARRAEQMNPQKEAPHA